MSSKIAGVQALRGIAIFMVAAFHFTTRYLATAQSPTILYPYGSFFEPLAPLLNQGRLGVELFFLISGFVISLTLTKAKTWREFGLKRVIRLWPALLLALPLIWLVLQFAPGFEASSNRPFDLLWSLTLINPAVLTGLSGGVFAPNYTTGVLWSLSVELMFYLLAALTYYGTRNFLRSQILVAAALLPFAVLSYQPVWPANTPMLLTLQPLVQLSANYFWFLGGVACFTIRFRDGGAKIWVLYVSCWLATCITAWAEQQKDLPWLLVVNTLIFALCASVALGNWALLAWKPLVALGDVSYEFYLVHEALGISLLQLIATNTSWNSPWLAVLPMVIAVPLAYAIKRYWSDLVGKRWRQLLSPATPGQL